MRYIKLQVDLKLYNTDIFINVLVTQKKKLQDVCYKVNGAGQQDGPFGISGRLVLVHRNGIINHLQGNLKAIVFMNQSGMNARKCIRDNNFIKFTTFY